MCPLSAPTERQRFCEALEAAGFRTAPAFDAREDPSLDEIGRVFFLAEKS
jgi:hypothetical protein